MRTKGLSILLLFVCATISACQTSKLLTIKPEVWKGDDSKVSVTRGAYQSTFDTAEVANEHCAKYGKMAKLFEEVNIWEIPNTDKYVCVKPE